MRYLRATRGTGDDVVCADRVALVAKAQLTFALQYQEHLLLAVMTMERALGLSRRQNGQVITELPRADVVTDLSTAGGIQTVVLDILKLYFVEVHDRFCHLLLHPRANARNAAVRAF